MSADGRERSFHVCTGSGLWEARRLPKRGFTDSVQLSLSALWYCPI
jgi:hypothetical protein